MNFDNTQVMTKKSITDSIEETSMIDELFGNNNLASKLKRWQRRIGLKINPFEMLDAGEDPFIPFYLVDHDQYKKINRDEPSFVFALAGGGKSAFRVRLARDCRINKGQRNIFPVVYKLPDPATLASYNHSEEQHLKYICRYASQELLLYLAYHPTLLETYDNDLLISIRESLDWNLPISLDYYLSKLMDDESILPLIDSFDRTAGSLPNPPDPKYVLAFAQQLLSIRTSNSKCPQPKRRFEILTEMLLTRLGFERIYILVDGDDAYPETGNNPSMGLEVIKCLLSTAKNWSENNIYLKFFLPFEIKDEMGKGFGELLTSKHNVAIINKWETVALISIIRQRLQEASGGKFNSLRAISTISLKGAKLSPEEVLVRSIRKWGNPTPRELIKAVQWLLIFHVQESGNPYKLTPEDLAKTCEWIRQRSL